jgi:hypothetical protein
MTTQERLAAGAKLFDRIDAHRKIKAYSGIFSAVEAGIVGRELDELEAEWRASSEVLALVLVRAPYTVRHLSSLTNPGKLES